MVSVETHCVKHSVSQARTYQVSCRIKPPVVTAISSVGCRTYSISCCISLLEAFLLDRHMDREMFGCTRFLVVVEMHAYCVDNALVCT